MAYDNYRLLESGGRDAHRQYGLEAGRFTREQVQEILLRVWHATHKMVFFITHSVEEALFLASRLIVMSPSPGRISHVYDDMPFCHEFLRTGDARAVKSRPDFIRMREEVLSLIHHREPANV